ncbi:unnamed protein product [Arctia plantaginis]|uniref:unspecific monooxygenase n=1 Tax=Arctia plantaginis TaxID=874455 RepID=A0A8S0ZT64_ARCPL|nr:unnamed protein product [Arctia plantaginis]
MFETILQLLLATIVLCLSFFLLFIRRDYGYWKKQGIPYEKPGLFFGNLGGLMRISMWDLFNDLSKKHKTDYVGIFLGWRPALVINSKELAKKILVKDFDSFQNRYSYPGDQDDPLGALNLFTVKSPMWSTMRHELAPMFTSKRLKGVTQLMNINSEELVRRIQTDHIDNNKPVDMKELFSMYTSDTVAYTVFGLRVSVLKELTSPLWHITRHMVKWTFWRGFEFTMIFFAPAIAEIMRLKFFSAPATEYVKKLFWGVVEDRQKTGKTDDNDLVNMLLNLKKNLRLPAGSDTELADNLMLAQAALFILGSVETSSTTMSFCLHELAYKPDKQEKLYTEISKALEDKGKTVLDFNDLLELHYLTACIKETLRKYPPVPFLDRVCNKTYKLTDKVTIEKDTPVYTNVIAIHYNEEYYPEPYEWRPERFAITTDNDNYDFTFLPFGEGPRFCIGKRYGLMQVRTAIAHIVMNFRIEPVDDYTVPVDPYSVILAPKTGGRVKFIPR